jgi:hypothetical protein
VLADSVLGTDCTPLPGALLDGTDAPHSGEGAAPGPAVPSTQLYFPDEPDNETYGIFDQALVMRVSPTRDGRAGSFTIVLA